MCIDSTFCWSRLARGAGVRFFAAAPPVSAASRPVVVISERKMDESRGSELS